MMIYFKDEQGSVYAYSKEQLERVNALREAIIESPVDEVGGTCIVDATYTILSTLNSLTRMTGDEVEEFMANKTEPMGNISTKSHTKQELIQLASSKIDILSDAIKLGLATSNERDALEEWKKFRVLVNRVDATLEDAVFPPIPYDV